MSWKGFGKVIATFLATLALLGAVGKGYGKIIQIDKSTADIVRLSERTTVLEQIKHDDHYMICVVFSRVVKDAVPASCSEAVK